MPYLQVNLGIVTADADNIDIKYRNAQLILSCIDYREKPCQLTFEDVLAFRWQEFDESLANIRDDVTYEVTDSDWLKRQAQMQGTDPHKYKHYMLCFNACGVLDVLAKPLETAN